MKQREPLTREAEGKMLGRNAEGLITILGVVRDGGFVPLEPADVKDSQLTNIAMQEAMGLRAASWTSRPTRVTPL
jgi:hypothetical protein